MHCNTLQHAATRCNALQRTATRGREDLRSAQRTATQCNIALQCTTHCNALQHKATHCNTLQHTATNTLQHTVAHCNTLQHTVAHRNTLQHTAPPCNALQHTATLCNTSSSFIGGLFVSCICWHRTSQETARVLQCVAVCCSALQCVAVRCSVLQCIAVCCSALQCVAVRCSVLQCVAVCCSVLQCVAVWLLVSCILWNPSHLRKPPLIPWLLVPWRVPGLPIRDCAGSCNSSAHKRTTMSAIDVTVKTFFERVYLIPGLSPFEHRVKCPCAPTPPPYAQQLFLDFCEFCFPEWPLNFFCHHDSPSNLAESRYPRYRDYPWKTYPQGKAFSSLLQRALAHAHSL